MAESTARPYRPTSPSGLADLVVDLIRRRDGVVIAAVDGADAAEPGALADAVADRLRVGGRAADTVALADFVRPASVRMEFGHTDAESYRTAWFDYEGLTREVITAARTRGRFLPRLWDARTDRSPRERPRPASDDHVVIVAGPMLSGRGLDLDVVIRLQMSEQALVRRTPDELRWTVAPTLEHASSVTDDADVAVRYDHPDRPAVWTP